MININQAEFIQKAQEEGTVVLDVRRPDECATGIVANAKTINFMDSALFLKEIDRLDKKQGYLVYCRSGNRSSMACRLMEEMGFVETYNLVGGMLEWQGNLEK